LKRVAEARTLEKLVSDKFIVALDCTVDLIASPDVKAFLDHFEAKIAAGKMGVMIFRSGQKFDLLGMDNFYGGYSIAIQKLGSAAFDERMDAQVPLHQGAREPGARGRGPEHAVGRLPQGPAPAPDGDPRRARAGRRALRPGDRRGDRQRASALIDLA